MQTCSFSISSRCFSCSTCSFSAYSCCSLADSSCRAWAWASWEDSTWIPGMKSDYSLLPLVWSVQVMRFIHVCCIEHVCSSKSLMIWYIWILDLRSWLFRNVLICINLISPLVSARDVCPGLPAVSGSGSRPGRRPAPSPSPEAFAVLSHRCSSDSSAPLSCPLCCGSSPGGISATESTLYL